MPARKRSFIYEIGATFQRVLYLEPGPDADVSSYTARMQIRATADSGTVILSLTTENSRITMGYGSITLAVADDVVLDLSTLTATGTLTEPAEDESDLPYEAFGKLAVYDLEVISSSGVVTRLLSGQIVFSQDITRS